MDMNYENRPGVLRLRAVFVDRILILVIYGIWVIYIELWKFMGDY